MERPLFYTKAMARRWERSVVPGTRPPKEIRERMEESGYRSGFACLFYGDPGTGKTETVYQLAGQTGRSILAVHVPEIKRKWVGDSEKNIKAVSNRYRLPVERSGIAPIQFLRMNQNRCMLMQ